MSASMDQSSKSRISKQGNSTECPDGVLLVHRHGRVHSEAVPVSVERVPRNGN